MSDILQPEAVLRELEQAFTRELAEARTVEALERLRVAYLGRKSQLASIMKSLGRLPPEERARVGQLANRFKSSLESALAAAAPSAESQAAPSFDATLPGRAIPQGRLHPITQTMLAIVDCFVPLGFEIVEGPELEYEFYNFDALNIPRDHPSREAFDTFFVDAPAPSAKLGRPLLRSHTSPVQVRVMQQRKPPLRILVPGKVFRPDPLDASHSFMFHQVEGLMVDERTSFADLKGVLHACLARLFGPATKTRFRPHYFPFTEPSAEVDIACSACGGIGCSTCGRKGWLEIMGCGMVHPNVFKAVGYAGPETQGFAFGMGVERIAMLRHGIRDIRLFFENDIRFLEQF